MSTPQQSQSNQSVEEEVEVTEKMSQRTEGEMTPPFQYDFSEIEKRDPSASKGFVKLYQKEIPFELKISDNKKETELGSLESIDCKILIKGDAKKPDLLRIELSCENDLLFSFFCDLDEASFATLSDNQKLVVDYPEFPTMAQKLFDNCLNKPESFIAVFTLFKEGGGIMEIIENLGHKFTEIITLKFASNPDEIVRSIASYKFSALKIKYEMVQNRIKKINNVVKSEDPQLIEEIQKAASLVKLDANFPINPIV